MRHSVQFAHYISDEDLNAMYLTEDPIREEDDHSELEVLLESFSKQVEEIVNEAENTQASSSSCWCLYYMLTSVL